MEDGQRAHLTGADAARVDGWRTDLTELRHGLLAEQQTLRGQRKAADDAWD